MVFFVTLSFKGFINFIRIFFNRMVKGVRRILQGQSQIARICDTIHGNSDQDSAPTSMVAAFFQEWGSSSKLKDLFEKCSKDSNMNIPDTLNRICQVKNIDPNASVGTNIRNCLQKIRDLNQFISIVKSYSAESFDSQNEQHEAKLESLWQLLLPDQQREGGRYTKEWGKIGFQQADPASDFRGAGILGLDQLIFMASTRTPVARRMLAEPASETSRYPWACVGINITMEAIRILESRKLNKSLFGKSTEQAFEFFNGFYADMFEIVHCRWVEAKPENLLAFPPVLKAAIEEVEKQIDETGSFVPPGTHA